MYTLDWDEIKNFPFYGLKIDILHDGDYLARDLMYKRTNKDITSQEDNTEIMLKKNDAPEIKKKKDEDDKTPGANAESRKHQDIVALLVEHKAGLQTAPAPAPAAAAEAPAPAAPGLEPCL